MYIARPRIDFEIAKKSILLVRPFHIVHQLTLIFLVMGVKGVIPKVSEFLTVWLLTFSVVPILFALNDYLHSDEDLEMGRKRLFSLISIEREQMLLGTILSFLFVLIITLNRSVQTTLSYLLLMTMASLYGYAKHKRMTTTTYTFRALSGSALYLFIASNFGLSTTDLLICIVIGLNDLQGHFMGDVRDFAKDSVVGVQTIVVKFGHGITYIVVVVVQLATIFIAILSGISVIPWVLLVAFILSWILYSRLSYQKYHNLHHAAFHGPKVLAQLFIGMLLLSSPYIITAMVIFALAWLGAYYIYLWSDNATDHANCSH